MAIYLIIKKHWIVFIRPASLILLGLFYIYISFGIKIKWFSIVVLIFGIIIIVTQIFKLLYLASVKWTFNGDELLVTRGILPWKKTRIQIPIFNIYDSSGSSGFLGHYLNFAHIGIRRLKG